jgi:hypothetical protein
VLKQTYNKVHTGKYLSDAFPIQNDLKQGDALSPLLFNSALKCVMKKIKENKETLELNVTYQLLVYADDVNLLGKNINAINKNTQKCHQTVGQNHNIKMANFSFENLMKFEYLGMMVTNQNCIHKETERHKTIILPVVLYGCEMRSPILSEEHKLCLRTECLREYLYLMGMK